MPTGSVDPWDIDLLDLDNTEQVKAWREGREAWIEMRVAAGLEAGLEPRKARKKAKKEAKKEARKAEKEAREKIRAHRRSN